jgi:transmembrane sensor
MRLHEENESARMKDQMDLSSSRPGRQALDWFVRRADGLDAAEEAAFQAWLRADPLHASAYAQWQEDWSNLDALPGDALDRLRRTLVEDKAAGMQSRSATSNDGGTVFAKCRRFAAPFLAPRSALAGTCLTLLLAGVLAWTYWRQPMFSESYATARGEQTEFVLPDGSRLQLDTASRADVAMYRGHREIHLPAGQVRLEVKSDTNRPFEVLAGPLRITVVGTRFAVRFTPDMPGQDGVRIAVEEGRVRVGRNGWFLFGAGTVELTAGQEIASDPAGALGAIGAVAPDGIAPWGDSRVSFDNVTLAQVLAEFERYGETRLVVRDPPVAALRLTGTFDPRRPENFARVLPQALPVRLVKAGDAMEIRARE